MNNLTLALDGAWKVLLVSLAVGAGLPVIFAFGVRAVALGAGGDAERRHARPRRIGTVLAALCFLIVLAGVVLGITVVVASGFGKAVSFAQVYPTIVSR